MNKETLKVVLLSAALAGTMVSCQKDGEMGPSQELSQKSLAQETSILFFWDREENIIVQRKTIKMAQAQETESKKLKQEHSALAPHAPSFSTTQSNRIYCFDNINNIDYWGWFDIYKR